MKKVILFILASFSIVLLNSCKSNECPFEYSSSESGHTLLMLCDCCNAPTVQYPHVDEDSNGVCDVCEYSIENKSE